MAMTPAVETFAKPARAAAAKGEGPPRRKTARMDGASEAAMTGDESVRDRAAGEAVRRAMPRRSCEAWKGDEKSRHDRQDHHYRFHALLHRRGGLLAKEYTKY